MFDAFLIRRRFFAVGFIFVMVLAVSALAAGTLASAQAASRTLKLYNTHTHERVSITFKKNGKFVPSALRDLNRFLRDWRRNEITQMDPELFDLIWDVYQKSGSSEYIHVVSGYRSPATNNMLRSRSRGVAKKSQHMRGKAMDFFIPGVKVSKLRAIGLRKEVGGVGYYPTSRTPFVHMDTGSVRHWPRMTRSQLAKVFPDGETIHVPSDRKPMPGYAAALARHKSGGASRTVVASRASSSSSNSGGARTTGQSLTSGDDGAVIRPAASSGGGGFLTALFSSDEEEDNASEAETPTPTPNQVRVAAVKPGAPIPPGELPGVSAPASAAPANISSPPAAPPIPLEKAITPADAPSAVDDAGSAPVFLASVTPRKKPSVPGGGDNPSRILNAVDGDGSPAPAGTLLAQAQTLAQGGQPTASAPLGEDGVSAPEAKATQIALVPSLKPKNASDLASASMVPVPVAAPAPSDAIAAIAAATEPQSQVGSEQETQLLASAMAYAPSASRAEMVSSDQRQSTRKPETDATPKMSVSGQGPAVPGRDPLAHFAALPDREVPGLLSAGERTETASFASLSHPKQTALGGMFQMNKRMLANHFDGAYLSKPSNRFEGPAIVILPTVSVQ